MTPATTLSLLTADDNSPAVLYTVGGGGVFLERVMVSPYQVPECQPAAGEYLSSSVASTTIPGFWIGAWTKYAGDPNPYLTTNGRAVACANNACGSDMNACPAGSDDNLARNPATVIASADITPDLIPHP